MSRSPGPSGGADGAPAAGPVLAVAVAVVVAPGRGGWRAAAPGLGT